LHAPRNFIVGGGWFAHATILPCSLAWEAFGEENGAATLREMRARIARYTRRSAEDREDFHIGCRILTQPFFLPEHAWIPVDDNYHRMCAVTRERTLPALEAAHAYPPILGRRRA
jgi:putative restriction endonuclease